MTDYWEARADFIEAYLDRTTMDPWWACLQAAKAWERGHSQLAGRMNLSMLPPGKKFTIERGLPVGADVLKLGPVRS